MPSSSLGSSEQENVLVASPGSSDREILDKDAGSIEQTASLAGADVKRPRSNDRRNVRSCHDRPYTSSLQPTLNVSPNHSQIQ